MPRSVTTELGPLVLLQLYSSLDTRNFMESKWVVLDFQTPSSNSADARDGLELPAVVDYIRLQYRL